MKNTVWIFHKEVKIFFGTYMAPMVLGGTAFLNSLFVMILNFNDSTNHSGATIITFVSFMVTIVIAMLILSMGSIVEEKTKGTLELLYTSPITDTEIVLGKLLFGSFISLLIAFGINAVFPFILYTFWKAPLYIIVSGCMGIFLLGVFSYSVGLFGSSLGKNHLLSLLISVMIIVVLWVTGFFSHLFQAKTRTVLYHLHIFSHFIGFARGVLPVSGIVFFLSGSFLFSYLTIKVLESRRWRG
jgi:ABC-2 type transport system permease protein